MSGFIEEVTAIEAHDRMEQGACLLDVREEYEWSAGHASSARHMALGTVAEFEGTLPKDRQIIVVCKAGGRSAQATAFLKQQGFDAVNLEGGMLSWAQAGLPFVDEGGQPGTIV